jgi:hypothetical protein
MPTDTQRHLSIALDAAAFEGCYLLDAIARMVPRQHRQAVVNLALASGVPMGALEPSSVESCRLHAHRYLDGASAAITAYGERLDPREGQDAHALLDSAAREVDLSSEPELHDRYTALWTELCALDAELITRGWSAGEVA